MAEAEERVNLDIDELLAGTDPNDYPGAVVTPTPTATPTATPPCFEAVFANFFAPQARKGLTLLKIQVSFCYFLNYFITDPYISFPHLLYNLCERLIHYSSFDSFIN